MQICLFRHAERENSGISNPPLTRRGHGQAFELAQKIQRNELPAPTRMFVSPKIRTHQTFLPSSELFSVEMTLTPELDERNNSETADQFRKRIQRFLNFLEKQQGVIFACTHLDWIEEALALIPLENSLPAESNQAWTPAQFLEFEVQDGLWQITKTGRIPC